MGKRIDRTNEEGFNNFGSKMIITRFNGTRDIDVYFPEFNWIFKKATYDNFKIGRIKCPYEKRFYNKGYLGEGKYKVSENRQMTKACHLWIHMLERCYDEQHRYKHQAYADVNVCDEWLNFQNFAKWYYDNYYEIQGEQMELDKDILHKGNKVYSPDNCIFVPERINILFVKNDKSRGEYPIGVCYDKKSNKFRSRCNTLDKRIHLGFFETPEKAFQAYKEFKEKYIKEVAKEYKNKIPNKLYKAMMEYEVEITD